MWAYLFRRLLLFIPTLLLISVVIFFLSRLSPGDPVTQFMGGDPFEEGVQGSRSMQSARQEYATVAEKLKLDKPTFYFSISGLAWPDTLYRVIRKDHRENLSALIAQYGNWPQIRDWYFFILRFEESLEKNADNAPEILTLFRRNLQLLLINHEGESIKWLLVEMRDILEKNSAFLAKANSSGDFLLEKLNTLEGLYERISRQESYWKCLIPVIYWYGFDNQYHHWFKGIWKGDWGVSLKDRQPVFRKIKEAAFWTLLINIPALLIAFGIAIPFGVWMSSREGRLIERMSVLVLYILYSMPNFWIATLLVLFLTTPAYGDWLHIFPAAGLSRLPASAPFWNRFWDTAAHLILPVFCTVYPALAFITQQIKGSMQEHLKKEYIKTARAKGIPEIFVFWKHAFRNALFPLITMIGSAFAGVLSGSIVIEFIFNIPGMGRLVYSAILDNDWPVTFGIVLVGAFLTITGYLLTDLLYVLANPRVQLKNRKV